MMKSMQRRNVFQASYKMVKYLLLTIVLIGCTHTEISKPRFSGDHTTTDIRGMWYICYQTRQIAFPYVLPSINTAHCDCLIDKSRESYGSSAYNKIAQDNLSAFFVRSSIECDREIATPVEPVKIPLKQL